MRISDWSSDVCSSDLPEITVFQLDAEIRIRITGEAAGDKVAPARQVVMHFRTARRHRHERERRPVRFLESPELATTVIAVDRRAAPAVLVDIEHALAASVAQPGLQRRSEEHTSELQSLMR